MIIRMKKIFNLMFAATLIGAVNVLSSFKMVNTIHHGENRGSKPVVLYMFYLSQKGLPLAVQHPEIPLE